MTYYSVTLLYPMNGVLSLEFQALETPRKGMGRALERKLDVERKYR